MSMLNLTYFLSNTFLKKIPFKLQTCFYSNTFFQSYTDYIVKDETSSLDMLATLKVLKMIHVIKSIHQFATNGHLSILYTLYLVLGNSVRFDLSRIVQLGNQPITSKNLNISKFSQFSKIPKFAVCYIFNLKFGHCSSLQLVHCNADM